MSAVNPEQGVWIQLNYHRIGLFSLWPKQCWAWSDKTAALNMRKVTFWPANHWPTNTHTLSSPIRAGRCSAECRCDWLSLFDICDTHTHKLICGGKGEPLCLIKLFFHSYVHISTFHLLTLASAPQRDEHNFTVSISCQHSVQINWQ